jgi:hypothetical protein
MKKLFFVNIVSSLIFFLSITPALSASEAFKDNIYNPGHLIPQPIPGQKACGHLIRSGGMDAGLLRSVAGL